MLNQQGLDSHLLPGLEPLGVAKEMAGTVMAFNYNDIESLKELFRNNPNEIAAIVLEPVRNEMPKDGFLEEVRQIATENNAVLIFDEITSGWRTRTSGVHCYGSWRDTRLSSICENDVQWYSHKLALIGS